MRIPDSAYYTALSVLGAIRAACEVRGTEMSRATVAIEGLGHVGTHLAQELARLGARVVAISTRGAAIHDRSGLDAAELPRLRSLEGDDFLQRRFLDRRIAKNELLELDVDVLVPAARPRSIHEGNAARIRARIVAPAANCPIVTVAEEVLQRNGVLVLPDFVCNLGGIYGSRLEARVANERIRDLFLNEYRQVVRRLITRAMQEGCTPTALATRIAEANHQRIVSRDGRRLPKLRRAVGLAGLRVLDGPLAPGWLTDRRLFHWAKGNLAGSVGRAVVAPSAPRRP
jgi:glutamate dehydrogenase (NAD(P)+)